ncbi:MAG: type II toxin-antitoxin system antitoxin SocA domain-containing protein [Promethearchaeota archaeon]
MDFKNLLIYLTELYVNKNNRPISKTKLLKLAYIAELFYYRKYRKRLTNAKWIYLLYGPWVKEYEEILSDNTFLYNKKSEDFSPIQINKNVQFTLQFSIEEKEIIDYAFHDFGNKDLNDILEYIYFDTEPMIQVKRRGEILNFQHVKPWYYYKYSELHVDEKIKQGLRKKYKKKLENVWYSKGT